MLDDRKIAYFSMEIALDEAIPTYSGGLGMLAGDTLRSAADLKVPTVGVSLLHRKGYFYQRLDPSGWQTEEPVEWVVEDYLEEQSPRISVTLEGRQVLVRAWKFDVVGSGGFVVPVYLLDTDLPDNGDWDRTLTHFLYGGDLRYRLCQEVILGTGGVRMLRGLGYSELERYHMNEGHAALLTLELLRERREAAGRSDILPEDLDAVRKQCAFTTHTPVPAGHDQFPLELVDQILGNREACGINDPICHEERLNMTYLALSLSHYVNGVAKKHGEVSRHMFAGYAIDSITNGVHAATWVVPEFQKLFDRYIPGWRDDNFSLRYALSIPHTEILAAHHEQKKRLIEEVNRQTNAGMDLDVLTIGFARRATGYKRPDLLLTDVDRLRDIAQRCGALQIVYAGKAHPHDQRGKELIQEILRARESLHPNVKLAYLANYDMQLARQMVSGVDVWLNTPQAPMEASGTSGMKAVLNGVPSLSILDGWWIEGCIEGVTGWAIGREVRAEDGSGTPQDDADCLYGKLEEKVLPAFYGDSGRFAEIMRHTIALNGSFFNTQRMMQQYVLKAYYE
jgi:starch phosphorylase